MFSLIEKDNNLSDKILKPDFSQRTGREFLAFYLQSKFKQILAFDSKQEHPIFLEISPDFISRFTKRLITNPNKRILIGITGESACGKTTICKKVKNLITKLNLPISVVTGDCYFKDISDKVKEFGGFDNLVSNGYEVDAPSNFQLDLLKKDLEKLSNGENIKSPQYIPNGTGVCIPNSIPIESKKIIIVEGMATMYGEVKDLLDVKIFIKASDENRKKRFLERAGERNQSLENALKYWEFVQISGDKYVKPCKKESDIVLSGSANLDYFSQIVEYIYEITNNFQ
jgi:uridine kinase